MSVLALQEGEYVIGEIRKHWWNVLAWGTSLFLGALLPLVVFIISLYFVDTSQFFYIFGFFYTLLLMVLWIIFFVEWTDYYLDIWIITNYRIVDIDQAGLFARNIATVRLEDVEDIVSEIDGFIPTFLHFGRITVQTAGTSKEFYLKNASNPEEAKQKIYKAVSDARERVESNKN